MDEHTVAYSYEELQIAHEKQESTETPQNEWNEQVSGQTNLWFSLHILLPTCLSFYILVIWSLRTGPVVRVGTNHTLASRVVGGLAVKGWEGPPVDGGANVRFNCMLVKHLLSCYHCALIAWAFYYVNIALIVERSIRREMKLRCFQFPAQQLSWGLLNWWFHFHYFGSLCLQKIHLYQHLPNKDKLFVLQKCM